MARGVGGALRADAPLQMGQEIQPVRVVAVLADKYLHRNRRRRRSSSSSSSVMIAWNARSQLASLILAGSTT